MALPLLRPFRTFPVTGLQLGPSVLRRRRSAVLALKLPEQPKLQFLHHIHDFSRLCRVAYKPELPLHLPFKLALNSRRKALAQIPLVLRYTAEPGVGGFRLFGILGHACIGWFVFVDWIPLISLAFSFFRELAGLRGRKPTRRRQGTSLPREQYEVDFIPPLLLRGVWWHSFFDPQCLLLGWHHRPLRESVCPGLTRNRCPLVIQEL